MLKLELGGSLEPHSWPRPYLLGFGAVQVEQNANNPQMIILFNIQIPDKGYDGHKVMNWIPLNWRQSFLLWTDEKLRTPSR